MGFTRGFVKNNYLPDRLESNLDLNSFEFSNTYEALAAMLRGNPVTVQPAAADWVNVAVGSGANSHLWNHARVETGTTASSSYLSRTTLYFLTEGGSDATIINWGEKLWVICNIIRSAGSDAEATAWLQIKEATTIGNLAAKGLGIVLANLTLSGESYGTQRNTTSLSTTLTLGRSNRLAIVHDPTTTQIRWYVNRVLVGTEGIAANIPSGNSGDSGRLMLSIQNGVTGTVNATFAMTNLLLFQRAGS